MRFSCLFCERSPPRITALSPTCPGEEHSAAAPVLILARISFPSSRNSVENKHNATEKLSFFSLTLLDISAQSTDENLRHWIVSRGANGNTPVQQFLSPAVSVILTLTDSSGESCEHIWDVSIVLFSSACLEMVFSFPDTYMRWPMHTFLMQFVHRSWDHYSSIKQSHLLSTIWLVLAEYRGFWNQIHCFSEQVWLLKKTYTRTIFFAERVKLYLHHNCNWAQN